MLCSLAVFLNPSRSVLDTVSVLNNLWPVFNLYINLPLHKRIGMEFVVRHTTSLIIMPQGALIIMPQEHIQEYEGGAVSS